MQVSVRGCYELWPVHDSIWSWLLENHTPVTFRTKSGCSWPRTSHSSERTPPTRVRSSRGLERAEVGPTHRLCGAIHASRPASVGSRLPTNAAMAQGRSVRADDPRFARTSAPFEGEDFGAEGGHSGLSHVEVDPRERLSGRLRWTQEQEGLESACCGGH